MRLFTCAVLALCATAGVAYAGEAPQAYWIWSAEKDASQGVATGERRYFRKAFTLPAAPVRAEVAARADDEYVLYVNGQRVGAGDDWQRPGRHDVRRLLRPGRNAIALEAANNLAGPAGLLATIRIALPGGKRVELATDHTWRAAAEGPDGWQTAGFDDSGWQPARELAPLHGGPWGGGTNRLAKPIEELFAESLAEYRRIVRSQRMQSALNLVPRPRWLRVEGGTMPLVRDGRLAVRLVACYIDEQEMFAARLVQAAAEELAGVKLPIVDAAVTRFGPGQLWVIRGGCGALPAQAREMAARARQLPPDGYVFSTLQTGGAPSGIAVSHEDEGLPAEAHTLVQLMQVGDGALSLPRCAITDRPALPWRGVVGGAGLADLPWLSFYKLNAAVYPVGYGEPFDASLADLPGYFHRWGVKPVLFWHPSADFCYADAQEVGRVCDRIREAASLGFRDFSINVDDFPEETVTARDKARFGTGKVGLLKAQMHLLRQARRAAGGDVRLWFCPRVYYNVYRSAHAATKPSAGEVAYRKGLGAVPADIVLWTTEPKLDYLTETARLWKRRPMVWHNYFLEFSQCGARYFEGYPALSPEFLGLVSGLWVEGDQFDGYTRASFLGPASAAWNPEVPVPLARALEREFGEEAGKALAEYARLMGASRGRLADHWSQPPTFAAKLFGTNGAGILPSLKASDVAAWKLPERIEGARQAAELDLAAGGVPADVAAALRDDARKTAANLRIWSALAGADAAARHAFWQGEGGTLAEELTRLGAEKAYAAWLQAQVSASGQ